MVNRRYERDMLHQFLKYANEDNVWYTLVDRNTGVEVDKGVLGKRYHWWILYALIGAQLFVKYWP